MTQPARGGGEGKPQSATGLSWLPAAFFAVGVCAFVIQGSISGANGLAVGVAAVAGPLVLLLLQVRLAGAASQSPITLGVLLSGPAVLGALWAAVAGSLADRSLLAAVAVAVAVAGWPLLLAVIAVAALGRLGRVDEPVDLPAYCAAVAFGWAAGFVAVSYGMSIREGVLDNAEAGMLVASLLGEALLRPLLVTATGCIVCCFVTWRPRRGSVLGLAVTLVVFGAATVVPALLDQANGLAVLAASVLALGLYAGRLIGRAVAAAAGDVGDQRPHEGPRAGAEPAPMRSQAPSNRPQESAEPTAADQIGNTPQGVEEKAEAGLAQSVPGQVKPASPGQVKPASPGQAKPASPGQAKPASPGQAKPA